MKTRFLFIFIFLAFPLFLNGEENPPQRIISSAPNFTEMLFALGLENRVKGVTDFCTYPPAALEKEKIGGFLNPNLEKIISLNPDLVVVPKTKSTLLQKLQNLRIPILELPNETITDALDSLVTIAKAAGVPSRGIELRKKMQTELEQIKKKYSRQKPVRTLVVVGRSPNSLKDMYAASPGTFVSELLTIAGGENILSQGTALYPKISKESLIALNPDAIIDTTLAGQEITTPTLKLARESWNVLSAINAVKTKRIYLVTDPSVTIQGPRLVNTAKYFAAILHKETEK